MLWLELGRSVISWPPGSGSVNSESRIWIWLRILKKKVQYFIIFVILLPVTLPILQLFFQLGIKMSMKYWHPWSIGLLTPDPQVMLTALRIQIRKKYLRIRNTGLRQQKPIRKQKRVQNSYTKYKNTNNLFPPIPCDTIMFIYDNYDNKYDNTISCSCLLFIKNLITMSLWNRISDFYKLLTSKLSNDGRFVKSVTI